VAQVVDCLLSKWEAKFKPLKQEKKKEQDYDALKDAVRCAFRASS
jgi:hypothetical protein